MKRRSVVSVILLLLVIVSGLYITLNLQALKDKFVIATTDIDSNASALKTELKLTKRADQLYEASQTKLQPAKEFRQSCSGLEQNNIILGCYRAQRIYVYNVSDPELDGVRQVTAAHELLHASYDRLSNEQRELVNFELQKQIKSLKDTRIKKTLSLYKNVSSEEYLDEVYAIFGTELKNLSGVLEEHFSQYFLDRQIIVDFADQYQSKFTQLEEQRQAYDNQLAELKTVIDELQGTINSQRSRADVLSQELKQLRSSGENQQYNDEVPAYNLLVRALNANIEQLRASIANYNELVEKRNALATAENDLATKLDSSATSAP